MRILSDTARRMAGLAIAAAVVLLGTSLAARADQQEPLQVVQASVAMPQFDVALTSELVLGKAWQHASRAQRARFQGEFAAVLAKTYADAFAATGAGARVTWTRASTTTLPGSTAVAAVVEGRALAPLRMIFAMRQDQAGSWHVYDVSFNGVSLVDWFRAELAAAAQSGAIEPAIAQLGEMQRHPEGTRPFAQAGG